MSRCVLAVLGLVLGACSSQPALVRVRDAQLEVAWVELEPPPGRPPVLLMNMVHLGEPGYYEAVQARLDRTPIVMMEGVLRERTVRTGETVGARIGARLFDLAASLRLVHQVDALSPREHFRSVDLTEREFRSLASTPHRGRGSGPRVTATLTRRTFAEWVVAAHAERRSLPAVMHVRHRKVLAALDGLSPDEAVVLCWGYAHGRSYLRALQERGYRVQRESWHAALAIE